VAMVLVRAALPHGQEIADELHIIRHYRNSPALRFPRMDAMPTYTHMQKKRDPSSDCSNAGVDLQPPDHRWM
jgi:hypothetical protein